MFDVQFLFYEMCLPSIENKYYAQENPPVNIRAINTRNFLAKDKDLLSDRSKRSSRKCRASAARLSDVADADDSLFLRLYIWSSLILHLKLSMFGLFGGVRRSTAQTQKGQRRCAHLISECARTCMLPATSTASVLRALASPFALSFFGTFPARSSSVHCGHTAKANS